MAIDWSGYDTFGKGIAQGIGSFADLAGLSGKAQSLAQLRATLNGQQAPETPFQKLGDLLKNAIGGGKGLDGRGVAQQTLGSLTGPQTPATVPAGPGASLSPQDMDTLTQRYGGGTAPLGAVTRGRDLTPADNFSQRYSAGDPNALKPMELTPQTAQTAKADISPAAAYVAAAPADPQTTGALPAPAAQPAPAGGGRGAQIYQGLIARGFTPVQAATLTGNMKQESEFRPGVENPQEGALGMLQWRLDRRQNLMRFAQQTGRSPTDIDTQLDFIKQEMGTTEKAAGDRFLAARTPEEANAALKGYIRYGDNTQSGRLNNAMAYLGGGGAGGGGGVQMAAAAPMGTASDATGTIPAAAAAPQGFGANIPTEALVGLLTNQYLPAEDKNIVMALLQTRMPQAKQYGFIQGADGQIYRTNATTGEAAVAAAGGMKPTADIQEYNLYKQQGGTDDFTKWSRDNKSAGRTQVNIDNSGQNQFSKDLGSGAAKMFTGMMEAGPAAQQDQANIGVLRDALSKAPTGLAGGIQSLAQDWGLNLGKNADSVQVVKAVLARLTPAQRVPGAGTTSDRDLAMFQNALPKLTGTPDGNALILDTMQAMAEYKQAQADIATRLATGEFKTDVDPTGMKGAVAALRALPDPMAAFKAKGRDVVAGKPYQSSNAAPGGQQPIPVKTPEEAAKLPSGTPILLPDGTTGVVP